MLWQQEGWEEQAGEDAQEEAVAMVEATTSGGGVVYEETWVNVDVNPGVLYARGQSAPPDTRRLTSKESRHPIKPEAPGPSPFTGAYFQNSWSESRSNSL